MRYLTAPFASLVTCAVVAQPTIGPAQFFRPDHSYLRYSYDISPTNSAELIAADGDLYTIDLAWVNTATLYTSDSIACITAVGNYPYFTDYYDTANVQLSIRDRELGGVRTHLFLVHNDSVQHVGGQPYGTGGTGDDLVFQRYPDHAFETILFPDITYGTTWTDTIDGEFQDASGSDMHYLYGNSTTTADGAGSITLPDGTYLPHTLRLRTVRDYIDSNDFFGDTHRQDTLYTWWVDSWDGPLMTLPIGDYGMAHGYVSPLPFTFYIRLGVVQHVAVNEQAATPVRLGPNPCTDRLQVHGAANAQYAVHDGSGRVVMQGRLNGDMLDVRDLPIGSYTLQLGADPLGRMHFAVAR